MAMSSEVNECSSATMGRVSAEAAAEAELAGGHEGATSAVQVSSTALFEEDEPATILNVSAMNTLTRLQWMSTGERVGPTTVFKDEWNDENEEYQYKFSSYFPTKGLEKNWYEMFSRPAVMSLRRSRRGHPQVGLELAFMLLRLQF